MKINLILSLLIYFLFIPACQQDPDSPPDEPIECPAGHHICGSDSTECCLDTPDDPIECPDGYHICGSDSTDCCLDTTSHNFVWELDTLGGYNSVLRDVAIIDENNAWVVGNIETDSMEYNAAHWNGYEWELNGIYVASQMLWDKKV
tara:strand:- start:11 stop:451 length:441 start_codon:yes stop_codon:yes gene_type:complete